MQQKQNFQRKQIFKERAWIYRHSSLFIYLGTFIGVCYTLSPLIYSLTHSQEEQRALRAAMGLKLDK